MKTKAQILKEIRDNDKLEYSEIIDEDLENDENSDQYYFTEEE